MKAPIVLICIFMVTNFFCLDLKAQDDPEYTSTYQELKKNFKLKLFGKEFQKTHAIVDSMILFADLIQNDSMRIESRLSRAATYSNEGKLDSALVCYERIRDGKIVFDEYRILSYLFEINLAIVYHKTARFEDAYKIFEKLAQQKLNHRQKLQVYSNWAATYITAKDDGQAIETLILADSLSEGKPIVYENYLIASNLARTLNNTKNYKSSLKYFKKELAFGKAPELEQYKLSNYFGSTYNHMINCYINLDSLDQAKILLDSTIVFNSNDARNLGVTYLRSAFYHKKKQLVKKAIADNLKAVDTFRAVKDDYFRLTAIKNLLELKFEQGEVFESKRLIKESYDCCSQFMSSNDSLFLDKIALFSGLQKKLSKNDYQSLLGYHKFSKEDYESSHQKEIAKLQEEFQADKRTAEIAALNLENDLVETKAKSFGRLAFGFSLLTMCSSFFFYRENRNKKKIAEISELTEKINIGLEQKNQEIKLLNRELSHRVKNNLEFISSLLKLQSRELEDIGSKEALLESDNRIQALSAVYKRLYGDDGIVPINLQEYLSELTSNLKDTFEKPNQDLKIVLNANKLLVPAEKATKIGLIVNELVTNSIKHAFQNQDDPTIRLELKQFNDQLQLNFSDNGVKVQQSGAVATQTKQSFGMGLIEKLVKQLNGKMASKNENGLSYDFSFNGIV